MKLNNKNASDLLQKDRAKSQNAAKIIVDNSDSEAWKCLIESSDYIFDFIKNAACEKLLKACNEHNIENLFDFLDFYDPGFDDFVAAAFSQFKNEKINNRFLELLSEGSDEQKAYAAKYFCYSFDEKAKQSLFENSKSSNQFLAQNCAIALASVRDKEAFDFYKDQLNSDDDWKKIQAVQFLSFYQDKNLLKDMLKAMNNSAMSEHIAGEIAFCTDMSEFFDSKDKELKELSLKCFDNILSSLSEIWPLATINDFKIFKGIKTIFELSQDPQNPARGEYSSILLKAKSMLNLFNDFDEYKFDEDKKTLETLECVCDFLNSLSNDFWEAQIDNLLDELSNEDTQRKSCAINLISYLELEVALPYLVEILKNEQNEQLVCEEVMAISKLKGLSQIEDKKKILEKIQKNENIKAIVKNLFATFN